MNAYESQFDRAVADAESAAELDETTHVTDDKGICWKHITVKGDDARILCGRASYEAVIRCAEHSPLRLARLTTGEETQ